MKLEEVNLDIESIKSIANQLESENLKKIHLKYCESMENILVMISSPFIFMTYAMAKVKENHLSIKSAVKLGEFLRKSPTDPKETAEELVRFFENEISNEKKSIIEEVKNESNKLYEKSEEIRNCLNNIGLNAVVNSWTLFESYSKEIWIKTFNENCTLLNNKIISDQEGDKTISLNILSKFNYNVSNNLGDILSLKYQFTGSDGIKKAFSNLLSLSKNEIKFFNEIDLNQLEIIRHILVHNAGIIDDKYLKRSNEMIDERIQIDISEINKMINCSINCMKQLLLLVDKKITDL